MKICVNLWKDHCASYIVHSTFYIVNCISFLSPHKMAAQFCGGPDLRHVLVIAPLLRRQSIIERILTSVQIVHRTFYILHRKLYLVSFTPQNGCAILRGPRSPFRWCISFLSPHKMAAQFCGDPVLRFAGVSRASGTFSLLRLS